MSDGYKKWKRDYDRARYLRLRAERDAARPPDPIELLSEVEIAYLAGLTDADGSIFVTHTNRLKTYYPAVTWAMTHKPTIDWVGKLLGLGTAGLNNHTNLRRGTSSWGRTVKFKPQWRVQVSGKRAQLLCGRMAPYMHTKRKQADLVALFPCDERRAPGKKLTAKAANRRADLGERISALNHAR